MSLLATIAIGLVTNAASAGSAAAASGGSINWTFVIATFTICLAAMGTLVKVFGGSSKTVASPGTDHPYCQSMQLLISNLDHDVEKLQQDVAKSAERGDGIKDVVAQIDKVVAAMLKDTENLNKGVEEMKKDYRELAHRLDGLLKQLLSWMADENH